MSLRLAPARQGMLDSRDDEVEDQRDADQTEDRDEEQWHVEQAARDVDHRAEAVAGADELGYDRARGGVGKARPDAAEEGGQRQRDFDEAQRLPAVSAFDLRDLPQFTRGGAHSH